jgi:glycosyltransferase involved in cell wall biosynthesis
VYFYSASRWDGDVTSERYVSQLRDVGVKPVPTWKYALELAIYERSYDVCIFEYYGMALRFTSLVKQAQPWIKVIVDTVDIHFLREELGLAVGISDEATVSRSKEEEIRAYRGADSVIAVSEEEKLVLQRLGGISAEFVIPVITQETQRSDNLREPELSFVGGFKHLPNVDGVEWFVREIWPGIRRAVPTVRFTVVGSDAPPSISGLDGRDGIEVVGYVPHTAPYLDRASVSVAPLRIGAGMKGKVTEAMAAALPVVSTTIGVQGLCAVPGVHCEIADSPEEFARLTVKLLNDTAAAAEIGRAGQRLVSALCGWQRAADELGRMLQAVCQAETPMRTVPNVRKRLRYQAIRAIRNVRRSVLHSGRR